MIWTFFYGSWIDLNLLKEKGFSPEQYEVARLRGYAIEIHPLANVFRSAPYIVYGLLLATSREKHHKILTALTQGTMGSPYLPEAVLVETLEGKWKPALCYTAERKEPKPASLDYIDPFIASAKQWKFPQEYIKHLESFRKNA